MARDEADREDLLREATALVERIELTPVRATITTDFVGEPGAGGEAAQTDNGIVAGFRAGGALSIFFSSDLVYQFNAAGELRRAYIGGRLFKAVRGQLVSLERQRFENEVQLRSQELHGSDQAAFMEAMQERLRHLRVAIESGELRVTGQVPADADVFGRLHQWLANHAGTTIARSPRV